MQRVSSASVTVSEVTVAEIGDGLLILLGIAEGDEQKDVEALVEKVCGLRIFKDGEHKMNHSIEDIGGAVLLISQFTLLADVRRGRRPSFVAAAPPAIAEPLIASAIELIRSRGIHIESGTFGADMKVALLNDGPVTIVLDVADGKVR